MSDEPNPKTLEALKKIKALLAEYDLWGVVSVSDTERTHWLYAFEPSWSMVHFNPETGEVRMRAKRADFRTAKGQHYVVQHTVGAIFNTRDFAVMLYGHTDTLCKTLDERFEIEHHPFTGVEYKK